ncbi:aldehyde dehydrogenase [Amycolatopsis sp. K13G38]|uniref:Aldehyde dehydrogenase n=1 Tax=Amycolatopsis acididurans TaxID=2724524 RepID=A0ABX1JEI9_9PSEU|nr:aldehyde dehydrogenase [Amycolatopsis acididurans]NKQ58043.1 aldehyde dehydrogenase [Amycolatopsis acididurans]
MLGFLRRARRSVRPGGFGADGWGRESGPNAMDEFLETKAVQMDLIGADRDPLVAG